MDPCLYAWLHKTWDPWIGSEAVDQAIQRQIVREKISAIEADLCKQS